MQILEPTISGPCFGVRDALAATDAIANPQNVLIHGELVHNPIINAALAQRGFLVAPTSLTINGLPTNRDTILITAHGVSHAQRRNLESAGKKIIDTTCPLVRRAHAAALSLAAQGYHVLIIGKPGHVEVTALSGDLSSFDILETSANIRAFPAKKLGVICQTTTPTYEARELLEAIARENPHAEIRFIDTICQPTKDRQHALEEILTQVDLMVIVGGRNSNNTRKLAERCRRENIPALHIEDAKELTQSTFTNIARVGLAAGTSTLPETVAAVRHKLESIAQLKTAQQITNAP